MALFDRISLSLPTTLLPINQTLQQLLPKETSEVLTARFYDAKFFFAEDRKKTLLAHGERLQNMRWVRKGGTVAEKVQRLEEMSTTWAPTFGADAEFSNGLLLSVNAI